MTAFVLDKRDVERVTMDLQEQIADMFESIIPRDLNPDLEHVWEQVGDQLSGIEADLRDIVVEVE